MIISVDEVYDGDYGLSQIICAADGAHKIESIYTKIAGYDATVPLDATGVRWYKIRYKKDYFEGYDLGKTGADTALTPDQDIKDIAEEKKTDRFLTRLLIGALIFAFLREERN